MIPSGYSRWREKAIDTFRQKREQYGESWAELSLPSLTDLMYIKAQRIRTLLNHTSAATGESPLHDWLALANYAAITIAKLHRLSPDESLTAIYAEAEQLLQRKNTDYGDAWQHMRPLAFIEFILMKLARIRQMDNAPEQNAPAIADNLFDIINYALLYLSRYGDTIATP